MYQKLSPRRRALSLLLALSLVLGLLPASASAEEAETEPEAEPEAVATSNAHWASGYLDQMVEWGFIRADQATDPDRKLTRADFMSIVNRAYGYHEPGPTPFEDITEYDWFYDDVGIAYNAGYIRGTSPTTASPNDELNRETATTILGRNMMLQESPGEMTDFSDVRDISNWARGTIKSSMEHYLVTGYDDGSFRPQKAMTWGEIAALVTRTIGTPLQDAGDYALGGVFGNVTITSPGVTLRDSVISGDVYVTGGVGLGGVKLENVTVLGRIITSGTGASEGGASILLRNVYADELLVDNLRGNEVSIQADGITEIGKTTVRTSAYIQDNTPEGMGLHTISLEGEYYGEDEEAPEGWTPAKLTLAGRIEEVINRTPGTTVHAAKGTVAKLTVDETAVGSHVIIDRGTVVKELILDAGIDVTGEGDVTHLEVNAPGANVEMLPDEIVIRPGITAIINGNEMDSASAEEFLLEPMILAGYPVAQDIAPTSLEAVFKTNKQGRIYWAISAITDGSIGEADLLKPPSYGNKAVRWGTVDIPRGNEEITTKITGLTSNGEYYLSAVLQDAKGQLSPVKVISFTTPDDTVPAFNTGYPYMSKVSPKDSVVVASVTKDCKLYYALLPEGAVAPTEAEFKANAVAGALGFGIVDMSKNVEEAFRVNDQLLEEKTKYILYLWLVDADGTNKSAVTPLPFTTDDETPPEFIVDPTVTDVKATSISLTFRLNEDGTVYWVAVPAGTVYPKPEPGTDYETAPLTSAYAILQVTSGMNIGTEGKFGKVTAVENVDGTITITGLQAERAYDFYYVAKDNAGPDRNYSVTVKKITINTLDTSGPKFSQRFSKYSGTDDTVDPLADTDIYLDVTENIRYTGEGGGKGFLEMYNDIKTTTGSEQTAAINKLASNLFGSIKLHKVSLQDNSEEIVLETHSTTVPFTDAMTIDYTKVKVESHEGGLRITFPAEGLHLENGAEYYFTIENLTDTSNNQNPVVPSQINFKRNEVASAAAGHSVPPFVVEFASVNLSSPGVAAKDGPVRRPINTGADDEEKYARVDFSFRMTPIATSTVSDAISYDILLWSDSIVTYDLYYRVLDETGGRIDENGTYKSTYKDSEYLLPRIGTGKEQTGDENGWIYLGPSGDVNPSQGSWSGKSVNKYFNGCGSTSFPKLKNMREDLRYEFVIELQSYKGSKDSTTWNGEVKFRVNVAAGQSNNLDNLAGQITTANWERFKGLGMSGGVRSIGRWYNAQNQLTDTQELSRLFTDSSLPKFFGGAPSFTPVTSDSVTINLTLTSPGTVYYAIGRARGADNKTPEITTTRNVLSTFDTGDITYVPGTSNREMYVTLDDLFPPPDNGSVTMPNWMKGVPSGTAEADLPAATDDPGKPNQVITPTSLNIFSPGSWIDTGNAITGSHRCAGIVQESITISDSRLTPDTDYFAYFVIKGESDDLSHVYIYHFKTDASAKPQINPTDNKDGSVDIWTHIASNYAYRVFTESDMFKIPILAEPFSKYVDVPEGTALPSYYVNKASRFDGYEYYTVLDALCDAYAYNTAHNGSTNNNANEPAYYPSTQNGGVNAYSYGASVFDVYANSDAREAIDALVRYGSGGSGGSTGSNSAQWVDAGEGSRTAGEAGKAPQFLDQEKIREGTKHVILIVAQSTESAGNATATDAERDGFRALFPVEKSAGAPPVLVDAYGTEPMVVWPTNNQKFNLTIEVVFDKAVYDADLNPLDEDSFMLGRDSFKTVITEVKAVGAKEGEAAQTFSLKFVGVSIGQTFTFPTRRFFNASGSVAPETLTISVVEERGEPETSANSDGSTTTTTKIYARMYVTWGSGTPIKAAECVSRTETVTTPAPISLTSLKLLDSSTQKTLASESSSQYDYRLELDLSAPATSTEKIEAVLTAAAGVDTSGVGVEWTLESSDVISVTQGSKGKSVQITGQKAGSATLIAKSQDAKGLVRKILVVVKTGITSIDMITKESASVKWNAEKRICTLTRSSSNTTPSASFTVALSDHLDSSVKVTVAATMNGKSTNAVKCTVSGNTITVQDMGTTKGTVTVTVKLESKEGIALGSGSFTVELTGSLLNTAASNAAKNPY